MKEVVFNYLVINISHLPAIFPFTVQSTEAFIMSPTLSGICLSVLALFKPCDWYTPFMKVIIDQNPPPNEARLAPGFICTVFSVQNICTAI